jgi:hypothetical protein
MTIGEVETGAFAIQLAAAQSVADLTLGLGKIVTIVPNVKERVS